MGIAEFSLLILFVSLCFASSSSELMQESKREEDKGIHESKIEGGFMHKGSSGHASPHGGGNGESRSPAQGGAGVIPLYAAGGAAAAGAAAAGANNHHGSGHRGANNSNHNRIELSTLLLSILLSYIFVC